MTAEAELLARHGLSEPDSRPLFAYRCDAPTCTRLARDLALRLAVGADGEATAARFVLWAAEEIRSAHKPGHLTWEWLFGRLKLKIDQQRGRELTERGLAWWRRRVRQSENGPRQYLYSLMAEGGLPEAYLEEVPRYRDVVLAILAEIEAEGSLAEIAAERIAWRRADSLPHTFRHDDTVLLLAELALALAGLRARLPADLPGEATELWLDQNFPGWQGTLPLPLSGEALDTLIRPALRAEHGAPLRRAGPLCRRQLRRRADGMGWISYAVVSDAAQLPARFLPGVEPTLRLRLLAIGCDEGLSASFLGVPEAGGWRLVRTGGPSDAALRLAPDQPLVFAAHVDGRPVGQAVVDAGLPPPSILPSLWRAADLQEQEPSLLEPVNGPAHTRRSRLWLLADTDCRPVAEAGLTIGDPEAAPSGHLWPITGSGKIILADHELDVITNAQNEAQPCRLHLFGSYLPGWRTEDGQIPFLGRPEAWGAQGDEPLRRLNSGVTLRPLTRRLGGYVAEWKAGGSVVARSVFVTLPPEARIDVMEIAAGAIRLRAQGLRSGWHLRLRAEQAEEVAALDADGKTELTLQVAGEPPASIELRAFDPTFGAALLLVGPWPTRRGMVVAPNGMRLQREQAVAIGSLGGWRGITPSGQRGVLLLQLKGSGSHIGVPFSGEIRLAAVESLVRLILALDGFDAEARLFLAVGGAESPRLVVRRYDNEAKWQNSVFIGGESIWHLNAAAVDLPGRIRSVQDISGNFDVTSWLGKESAIWLVQARTSNGAAARPAVWSSVSRPFSTRDARIAEYAQDWQRLLSAPHDSDWDSRWTLIKTVQRGGDAGALDQVQALARSPAAAVAMLFRVPASDLASALALEGTAPIWWPVVSVAAWTHGVSVAQTNRRAMLRAAGFSNHESVALADEMLERRAGALLTLRPEIRGYLGAAFAANDIVPLALLDYVPGGVMPLAIPDPVSCLDKLMQEAGRRETSPPEGTRDLPAARLSRAANLPDHLRALLDAPLVAAEIASLPMSELGNATLIQLIALRQADPIWFDAALPAAIQLYLREFQA